MGIVATVKIMSETAKGRCVTINEEDFDKRIHKLYAEVDDEVEKVKVAISEVEIDVPSEPEIVEDAVEEIAVEEPVKEKPAKEKKAKITRTK